LDDLPLAVRRDCISFFLGYADVVDGSAPKIAYKWLPDFANAIAVPETEP
jgi:hypothetical protein